ncbi:MAG: hypothetical protein IKR86_09420 [Candidatus Methanomethylophilaceae archaeon]|nr:hypothetical protein [Candidatus Methanomethylophilaceae archaeon]
MKSVLARASASISEAAAALSAARFSLLNEIEAMPSSPDRDALERLDGALQSAVRDLCAIRSWASRLEGEATE